MIFKNSLRSLQKIMITYQNRQFIHYHDQIIFSIKLILMKSGLGFGRNSIISYLVRNFCQTKPKASIFSTISPGAQKALWAREIIAKVAYADERKAEDIMNPSLRQLIINCQVPTKDFKFDDIHKKEVINMFEQGIHLNQNVFRQSRVFCARNSSFRLLIFCPNLLVTRPIFLNLLNPRKYTVFDDVDGISKTISTIMFIELSRHIHKYIYDATCSGSKELEEEYKMLRQKDYLHPTNKYWYWSIDPYKQQKSKQLQYSIAAQATQLSKEKQLEIRNCPTFAEAIILTKNYYCKAEITHISVVDQINFLTQMMKKWNDYSKIHRQDIQKKEDSKDFSFTYQKAIKIQKQFKQFLTLSTNENSCILLSTINLEPNFMFGKNKSTQEYAKLSLQVIEQGDQKSIKELSFIKLNYLPNLFKTWGKNDFWHCCWFQFSRKIRLQLFEERWIQLRKSFLDHVSKFEIRQYYRFIEIYILLSDHFYEFEIANAQPQEAEQMIAKIMSTFDYKCFHNFIENSKKFIEKKGDQSLKKEFLRAMYIIALRKKFRGQQQLIISFDQLAKLVKTQILTPLQYFHSHLHDRELIPVENINQLAKEIKVLGKTEHFCNILQNLVYSDFTYQQILMSQFQLFLLKKESYLEALLKSLIRFQLQKGTILELVNFNRKREYEMGNGRKEQVQSKVNGDEKLYEKVKYKIKSAAKFPAFPQQPQKYDLFDFKKSLKKLIKKCDKNPDQWVAGIPKLPPRDDQQPQLFTNANVDFIIAKCQGLGKAKKYVLNCFDLSIFGDSFTEKESKANKLYSKLLKHNQKKFQINHIILCLQKNCLGCLKEDESSLTVIYSDIGSMRFEKAPYPNELVRFEGIQRYLLLRTIEQEVKGEQ